MCERTCRAFSVVLLVDYRLGEEGRGGEGRREWGGEEGVGWGGKGWRWGRRDVTLHKPSPIYSYFILETDPDKYDPADLLVVETVDYDVFEVFWR